MTQTNWRFSGLVALCLAAGCVLAALPARGQDADDAAPKIKKSGGFSIGPKGYGQGDLRFFPNWDVAEPELRNDSAEVTRLRIGVQGDWHRLSFELEGDPTEEGSTSDKLKSEDPILRVIRPDVSGCLTGLSD